MPRRIRLGYWEPLIWICPNRLRDSTLDIRDEKRKQWAEEKAKSEARKKEWARRKNDPEWKPKAVRAKEAKKKAAKSTPKKKTTKSALGTKKPAEDYVYNVIRVTPK
jgi:hypothetical protein